MRSTASLLLILADINAVARAAPITPSHELQAQGQFLKDRCALVRMESLWRAQHA